MKARHGWASLTPTEHTVARLAADGLSNPQIGDQLYISHRTVQTQRERVEAGEKLLMRYSAHHGTPSGSRYRTPCG